MRNDTRYGLWLILALVFLGLVYWYVSVPQGAMRPPPPLPGGASSPQSGAGLWTMLGTVESVDGDMVTIETMPSSKGAAAQKRSIDIGSSTVIERVVLKDQAELQKEFAEFSAQEKDGTKAAPPPPFLKKTITLAELKKGDCVIVTLGEAAGAAARPTATVVIVQPPTLPFATNAMVPQTTAAVAFGG